MRGLTFLFPVVFLSLSSVVFGQVKTSAEFLIQEGKVGKVEINMPVEKLNNIYSKDKIEVVNYKEDGNDYSLYKVYGDDKKKSEFEIETLCVDICMVSRIMIFSSKYRTAKDIGIGSTYADLKSKYTVTSITGGEKGLIIYVDELSQVGFIVNVVGVTASPGQKLSKTVVPETTAIETIEMY